MAAPTTVTGIQAMAPGDLANYNAHFGTGDTDFRTASTARAVDQFQTGTATDKQRALAVDQAALTAIAALLVTSTGSRTAAQLVATVTAIKTAAAGAGRTVGAAATWSGA